MTGLFLLTTDRQRDGVLREGCMVAADQGQIAASASALTFSAVMSFPSTTEHPGFRVDVDRPQRSETSSPDI